VRFLLSKLSLTDKVAKYLMDIVEAVKARKSIRGFKPDPVPKETLKEILEIATRSPSANNTQPWEFTVVAGDVLKNIGQENIAKLTSGAMPNNTDLASEAYQGVYKQRQVNLAVQIFNIMGIAREDKAKRMEWMSKGFGFFGAPAAVIITADNSLDTASSTFDIGAFTQTFCLVALKYGLGTCIERQGVMFSDVVRKHTGIPDTKRILISIAIGYPDENFPANNLKSERDAVDNLTTWHGFYLAP